MQLPLSKTYSTFRLSWKLLWSWIVLNCLLKTWDTGNCAISCNSEKELALISMSNYKVFKLSSNFWKLNRINFLLKIQIREICTISRISPNQKNILLSIKWPNLQIILVWSISGHYYIWLTFLRVLLVKVAYFTLLWNPLHYTQHDLRIIVSGFLKIPWLFLQIRHGMIVWTLVGVQDEIWLWHKEVLLIVVVIFRSIWIYLVVRLNIFLLKMYAWRPVTIECCHMIWDF